MLAFAIKKEAIGLTSNQSIHDISKFQKVDDVIHVSNFLFMWNCGRLTENGGEDECFPHGRCGLVYIQLLTVTRGSLEANTLRAPVDQD